ncbi:hypothetical protein D6201_07740 [Aurantiacibacter aquimixticola]|uniref:Uncharacterized protein n=1 Tax=Aurantiacibacter aquimixticola TaxID=1958945 RepID=A0A419RU01_9SPHN|nr:hypothetical protein D6201_07740 [Aurantiacibacter aquimixticola]
MPPAQLDGESDADFAHRLELFEREREHEAELSAASGTAWANGYENAVWEASPQVVVARLISRETTRIEIAGYREINSPLATLEVTQTARGAGAPERFTLQYTGLTSCGPTGPLDVLEGEVGDEFVIFAGTGALGMKTLIKAYPAIDFRRRRIAAMTAGD